MFAELHNFVLIGVIAMAFGYITGNTRQLNAWKVGILGVVIWLFVAQFNHSKAHFLVMMALFLMGFFLPHAHLMEGFGRSLSNAINAVRYRSSYADLKRKEEELEAMRQQFASQQAQQRQQEAQDQWQKRRQQAADDGNQQQSDSGQNQGNNDDSGDRKSGRSQRRRGSRSGDGSRHKRTDNDGRQQSRRRSGASSGQKQGSGSRSSRNSSGDTRSNSQQKRTHQQKTSSSSTGNSSNNNNSSQHQSSSTQPPPNNGVPPALKALRDKYLTELELVPGQSYTKAELKTAFKRSANKYHPDKHQGKPPAFLAQMEAKFIAMKSAHAWLESHTPN